MSITTIRDARSLLLIGCAVLTVVVVAASGGTASGAALSRSTIAPIVWTDSGAIRGEAQSGGYAFRGVPYAAPPTGSLRWRAPRPPASWGGVRDAIAFAPSCPQQADQNQNPFVPAGVLDEDCLYLNVSTPTVRRGAGLPVLVWIHGGGFTQDGARNFDGTELSRDGLVVVTINYRLGALGFLSHPALALWPGGPSGNYGLMDQQAALRWVQRNIRSFGGNPRNVTIAGQSAGGLSVLMQLVSPGARGLFQRAIVQSGTFAMTQLPLASAEAFGEVVAAAAGCPDQTAACLRGLSVDALQAAFPPAAIPGVVDGRVLQESVGTALAGGRFARVPILNGMNHDEERLFLEALRLLVSGGMFVGPIPEVTADNYQQLIASALGVSDGRAAEVAAEYPLAAFPTPTAALSTLVGDANFACSALQLDRWVSGRTRTFAYEFNDDDAPLRFTPPGAVSPVATHSSELQYLFDLPNAPVPGSLNPDQGALAVAMRRAWARFAANGNPSSVGLGWPSFDDAHVMSLVPPQPVVESDFVAKHHCSFWTAG